MLKVLCMTFLIVQIGTGAEDEGKNWRIVKPI